MIIDGKKLACATCIKGHRASHCKHKDRPLVEIKKKGRPATQCERCRELRTVRQLHVKCDCDDNLETARKRKRTVPSDKMMKEAAKSNLRLIAPKLEQSLPQEEQQQQQQQQQPQSPQQPPRLSPSPPPQLLEQQQKIVFTSDSPPAMSCGSSNTSSCCSTKSNNPATTSSNCCSTKTVNTNTTSTTTSTTASQHKDGNDNTTTSSNICPPSGCGCGIKEILPSEMSSHLESSSPSSSSCGTKASSSSSSSSSPPTEASSGRVRIVTCRCGDSCACPGCDAHPSRVMKGQNDPYTGFATDDVRRRLSIAAICLPSDAPPSKRSSEQPTSILREDGIELCGCGCSQTFDACSDCFRELCH